MPAKLYKITGESGEPLHGGSGIWNLPKNGKPGKWMPAVKGKVLACHNGYHLVTAVGLIDWLRSPALVFEAEGEGEKDVDGTKTAFRRARLLRLVGRLDDRNLRHFAADCAQLVLPLFEKQRPNDDRPRKAIQVARDFADGKIDAAAGDAAGAAAWAARAAARAARDAAWAAGRAAGGAAGAAARAAGDAAGPAWAAGAAAGAARAAGDAAGDAARKQQTKMLIQMMSKSIKAAA